MNNLYCDVVSFKICIYNTGHINSNNRMVRNSPFYVYGNNRGFADIQYGLVSQE